MHPFSSGPAPRCPLHSGRVIFRDVISHHRSDHGILRLEEKQGVQDTIDLIPRPPTSLTCEPVAYTAPPCAVPVPVLVTLLSRKVTRMKRLHSHRVVNSSLAVFSKQRSSLPYPMHPAVSDIDPPVTPVVDRLTPPVSVSDTRVRLAPEAP
jgi:hypothetical protein